jgi:hypothetical protein
METISAGSPLATYASPLAPTPLTRPSVTWSANCKLGATNSAAAMDQCTLSAVRPGQTFSRTDSGVPGAADDLVTTVINKTVYVDVTC